MMVANRPHARRRRTEIIQLLWHPGHSPRTNVRIAEIPAAYDPDSKLREQCDRGGVERVARSNPDTRRDSFALEDFQPAPKLLPLHLARQTGKLALLSDGDHARAPGYVAMLESVQRDRPAAVLPGAHAVPKIPSRRVHLQPGIAIVRHHRQERLEPTLNQYRYNLRPHPPVHGRADVIKPEEILSGARPRHRWRRRPSRGWGCHGIPNCRRRRVRGRLSLTRRKEFRLLQ